MLNSEETGSALTFLMRAFLMGVGAESVSELAISFCGRGLAGVLAAPCCGCCCSSWNSWNSELISSCLCACAVMYSNGSKLS